MYIRYTSGCSKGRRIVSFTRAIVASMPKRASNPPSSGFTAWNSRDEEGKIESRNGWQSAGVTSERGSVKTRSVRDEQKLLRSAAE